MTDDRYVFVVEWYDSLASLVRTYNFIYFLKDNTIEMVNRNGFSSILKTGKCSLKDASTQECSLRIFSLELSLMSILVNLKLWILLISSLVQSSKTRKESTNRLISEPSQ